MKLERKHKELFFEKLKKLKNEEISQYSIQMLIALYEANEDLGENIPEFNDNELNYETEIIKSLKDIRLVLQENNFELKGLDKMYEHACDQFSGGNYFSSLETVFKMRAALGREVNPKFQMTIEAVFEKVYMDVVNDNFHDIIVPKEDRVYKNTRK